VWIHALGFSIESGKNGEEQPRIDCVRNLKHMSRGSVRKR
jgi:hypothetical protein